MISQNSAVATPVAEPLSTERVWPTYDHRIELEEAQEMIGRYRRANPDSKHAVMYTRVPFDRILAQPGCSGIRMYYAMHPDGLPTLVLVGVDVEGNDMDQGELAEWMYPCPPVCAINSALDL